MQDKTNVDQSSGDVPDRPERPEPADAVERPAVRRVTGHGTSSFQRIVSLGAFAALDEVPPEDPDGTQGKPRWSERFGFLVSAFQAERRGLEEETARFLKLAGLETTGEEDNVGDVVVANLGRQEPNEELFDELFGWSEDASIELYVALPFKFKPIWIIQILCCALGYRRNTFGRYFGPNASPPLDNDLIELSQHMNEGFESATGDSTVPAGFIFFGQFLDHDITLDTSTRLSDLNADPATILNVRTPAMDLDNVYADGPEGSPELYDTDPDRGPGFLLVSPDGNDLPRNQLNRAIIGDPRNDENTIVSQLHLHVLHFHNAVLRMIKNAPVDVLWGRNLAEEPKDGLGDFEFARRLVRWHYQWAVVNDYLPRIIEPTTLAAAHAITNVPQGTAVPALPPGFGSAKAFFDSLTYINCCGSITCRPLMPVEFSAAAFRFAHSQVRSRYDVNASRLAVPLFEPRPPGLASFMPVPNTDVIEWERFFNLGPNPPQFARQIDTWLPAQVFMLPFASGEDRNLALRNLRRGARVYALPSGGDVAAILGVSYELGTVAINKLNIVGIPVPDAPLWYAVLGEAEFYSGQLGPVGGLLVGVTLLRMLQCDDSSYVHAPGWTPMLSPADPGEFSVADLVRIGRNERMDAFPG
ncbi:MAG: peroxidase family protein [Candidatus Promineifilaceae bacterium]